MINNPCKDIRLTGDMFICEGTVTGRVSSKIQPAPTDQETRVPLFKVRASKTMLDALTSMRRGDVELDDFNRMLEWVIHTHMSATRRINERSNPL